MILERVSAVLHVFRRATVRLCRVRIRYRRCFKDVGAATEYYERALYISLIAERRAHQLLNGWKTP